MNEMTEMTEMTETKNEFLTWLAGFGEYAPLLRILLTVVLVAIGLFGARLFRWVFHQLRSRLEGKLPDWLQILFDGFTEPAILFVRCLLWYFAFLMFPWSFDATSTVWKAAGTAMAIAAVCLLTQGLWNSAGLCRLLLRSAQNRLDLETNKTMNSFFEKIYRALVLLFGGIQILDLLGCEVNGLITGAGIAGLAVSLGAQSTLSNLIAGASMVIERPFGIGDYITLGSFEGAVEDISFRSTRIRTLDNSVITVENSKVSAEYICNATARKNRLLNFTLGVTYGTPRERLEALCEDLRALLKKDPQVLPESIYVTLSGFGASSIDIEVRCYVTALGGDDFRQLKSRLNWQIMDIMEHNGCDFAFPSTSVYLETPASTAQADGSDSPAGSADQ